MFLVGGYLTSTTRLDSRKIIIQGRTFMVLNGAMEQEELMLMPVSSALPSFAFGDDDDIDDDDDYEDDDDDYEDDDYEEEDDDLDDDDDDEDDFEDDDEEDDWEDDDDEDWDDEE